MTNSNKTPSRINLLEEDLEEQGVEKSRKLVVKLDSKNDKSSHKHAGHESTHCHNLRINIKKCDKSLFVGLDIKFTTKIHPVDGLKGLGRVYKIHRNSPGESSSIRIGDRVLTLFGKVVHTKEDLYAIIKERRVKIAKNVIKKKFYSVPIIVERPCAIAKMTAFHLAHRWLDVHGRDTELCKDASFEYTCEECQDTVKFFIVPKTLKCNKLAPCTSTSGKGSKSKCTQRTNILSEKKEKKAKRNPSACDVSFTDLISGARHDNNRRRYDTTGILIEL